MSTQTSGTLRHSWERWDWLWSVHFYLTLTVVTGIYLAAEAGDATSAERNRSLILLGSIAILHTIVILSPIRSNSGSTRLSPLWMRLTYCVTLIGLWTPLANTSGLFFLLMFIVYPEIGRWVEWRWMALLMGIVTTIYFLTAFGNAWLTSFAPSGVILWMFFIAVIGISVLGYWLSQVIDQSYSRHELIQQLQQTRAELATSERNAGMLKERQRLAHEIHDTLAQGFTSIVMHLEAADQVLQTDTNTAQQHLDYARNMARHSLDQARRVINDLRPQPLEDSSLIDALERLHEEFAQRTDVQTSFNVTGEPEPLHPHIEVTLLRATQEALNNISKHAQASETKITLSFMGDLVMLDVQDNGVGMCVDDAHQGYGLTAMRQRVAEFSGAVELESAENEGTTLVVSIPLN